MFKDENFSSKYDIILSLFVFMHSDFIFKKDPFQINICIVFANFLNRIHYIIQKKSFEKLVFIYIFYNLLQGR